MLSLRGEEKKDGELYFDQDVTPLISSDRLHTLETALPFRFSKQGFLEDYLLLLNFLIKLAVCCPQRRGWDVQSHFENVSLRN